MGEFEQRITETDLSVSAATSMALTGLATVAPALVEAYTAGNTSTSNGHIYGRSQWAQQLNQESLNN
jgi:hypothetical protein